MYIGKNRAIMIMIKEYEEMIYKLSLFEGNQMTLLETARTISGLKVEARPRDIVLVMNLKHGFDYVLEKVKKDNFFFDKNTLCMINRLVAANDNYDNIGGFRRYSIKILGSTNKGEKIENFEEVFFNLINEFHTATNENKYIDLFLKLSKSQFFGDGNKRTAQLMMNGLLMQDGYAPFIIDFTNKEYAKELIDYYDNGDIKIMDTLKDEELMNLN